MLHCVTGPKDCTLFIGGAGLEISHTGQQLFVKTSIRSNNFFLKTYLRGKEFFDRNGKLFRG